MRLAYLSLGCKVNEYESKAIVNEFTEKGFTLVDFTEQADIYLINTCTVTHVADQKSRQMIHRAHRLNPAATVVVMGCYSQLNADEVAHIEGVSLVFGTRERDKIVTETLKYLQDKNQQIHVLDLKKSVPYDDLCVKEFNDHTRGFVKIQDGCDNFCSYCAIPLSRGRIASRNPEAALNEIKHLVQEGMKEIVLTGINTGTYGQDLGNINLAQFVERIICEVPSLERIRISSIEESEVSDELLNLFIKYPHHLCEHLHLPLQGGSDAVLKSMRRKYTTAQMKEKIEHIRSLVPGIAITADVMVGFSGETDENFQESLDFVTDINYAEIHVFPYSRRPHTLAYTFKNIVDPITKKARTNSMMALGEECSLKYRQSFKNKVVEVLVEKNEDGWAYGHSREYLEVKFASTVPSNTLCYVVIEEPGYPVSLGKEVEHV